MPFVLPHVSMMESTVQHNLAATPTLTPGTSITSSGTAHVKGSWTSLIDPVNFDVYRIVVTMNDNFTAGAADIGLVDIGVGPTGGGSEQVILPNLLAGSLASIGQSTGAMPRVVDLPFFIQAGTRISARWQSNVVSNTVRVAVWVWGGPSAPPWPVFCTCDAYGVTTASSTGTAITAGNTGAESAWTSVGSTLSQDYQGFFHLIQGNNITETALAYHWEIGYSSTTMCESYTACTTSEIVSGPFPAGPAFQPCPSGTQMQARGECSGTAVSKDLAIYMLN